MRRLIVGGRPVVGDHGVVFLLEHEVLVALDGLGDDGLTSTLALEADALRDLDRVGATLPVLGEGPDPGLVDGVYGRDAVDHLARLGGDGCQSNRHTKQRRKLHVV